METHWVETEVALAGRSGAQLRSAVEAELRRYGRPLRWAIVAVSADRQRGRVEAIVTAGD
ncbi:MAG: hypothetical protein BRC58_10435 [Cyanobacteria bacterium QS_8_64_29]|nr:MAG: hypothetical protein BRC58_10435 [Cyanobacteria bacterium QS_8_64_29]